MTSPNHTEREITPQSPAPRMTAPTTQPERVVTRRESRRERRQRRRIERREQLRRAKAAWVARSVDADLPERVQDRVPGWAESARGRVVLAVVAVVALLVWALAFVLILGL